jgi:hypothetical protein
VIDRVLEALVRWGKIKPTTRNLIYCFCNEGFAKVGNAPINLDVMLCSTGLTSLNLHNLSTIVCRHPSCIWVTVSSLTEWLRLFLLGRVTSWTLASHFLFNSWTFICCHHEIAIEIQTCQTELWRSARCRSSKMEKSVYFVCKLCFSKTSTCSTTSPNTPILWVVWNIVYVSHFWLMHNL